MSLGRRGLLTWAPDSSAARRIAYPPQGREPEFERSSRTDQLANVRAATLELVTARFRMDSARWSRPKLLRKPLADPTWPAFSGKKALSHVAHG